MNSDDDRHPSSTSYTGPAPTFTTDWVTNHTGNWKRYLSHLRGVPGVRALEIGVWEGRSTFWWLENIITGVNAKLVAVDDHPERFEANRVILDQMGLGIRLRFHADLASEFLLNITRIEPEAVPLDFAYLDGGKHAHTVLEHSVLTWRWLKNGGVMIWDDYGWSDPHIKQPPRVGIDAFLSAYEGQYQLLHKNWQVIIRKQSPLEELSIPVRFNTRGAGRSSRLIMNTSSDSNLNLTDGWSSDSPAWQQQRVHPWRKILLPEYAGKLVHGLEIGSYEGRSAHWFLTHLLAHPDATLTCVDEWPMQDVENRFRKNLKSYERKLTVIKGQSSASLRTITKQFDFIYVDGSHEIQDVLLDAAIAWTLLKTNGIMMFDDYGVRKHAGVRLAANTFVDYYKPVVLWSEYQLIVRKPAASD